MTASVSPSLFAAGDVSRDVPSGEERRRNGCFRRLSPPARFNEITVKTLRRLFNTEETSKNFISGVSRFHVMLKFTDKDSVNFAACHRIWKNLRAVRSVQRE